jgi:hypothetical protein
MECRSSQAHSFVPIYRPKVYAVHYFRKLQLEALFSALIFSHFLVGVLSGIPSIINSVVFVHTLALQFCSECNLKDRYVRFGDVYNLVPTLSRPTRRRLRKRKRSDLKYVQYVLMVFALAVSVNLKDRWGVPFKNLSI